MILYINSKNPKVVEIALKKDGKVVAKLEECNEYGSQMLLPLIEKILKENNLALEDLTQIEAEEGPGSFTGLRVGASVAQALGYSLNIVVNGQLNKPMALKYT